MPEQITPHIQHYYNDDEILLIIDSNSHIKQQFSEPDIANNEVCVVLPVVYRRAGYTRNQFDLDIFFKHDLITDLGQFELFRVSDFIRQKVDVAPIMHTANKVTGVDVVMVMESIKKQIKFLQQPDNYNLPMAPAQMLNLNL